ncbi:MAG: hypothetical protein GEU73_03805 [Chloroflexi bacterium]|nr:hypothetical protein [Chloroflexota bacterium]
MSTKVCLPLLLALLVQAPGPAFGEARMASGSPESADARAVSQSSAAETQSAPGWTLLTPPGARSQHSAAWDPTGNQMLVLGGSSGGPLADFWSYRPATDTWIQIMGTVLPHLPSTGHRAVWDTVHSQMLVFGGLGGEGDLWSYRPASNTWTELHPQGDRPSARAYHSAVWDPARAQIVVFAGLGAGFGPLNDLWAYSPDMNTWSRLEPGGAPPLPLFYHAAVWDDINDQMLVFGGADPITSEFVNELWSYQPTANVWSQLLPTEQGGPVPPGRLSHVVIWDRAGSQMLIFGGGCGPGCYLGDVWSYRPSSDSWSELPGTGQPPSARGGHTAVWDPEGRRMVVYGGSIPGGTLNDVWSYRLGTYRWSQVSRGRPAPIGTSGNRAAWDTDNEQLLVFEGLASRLWSYRPASQAWAELRPEGVAPTPREDASIVWDPTRGQLLLFGGYRGSPDTGFLNDLWAYRTTENAWAELDPGGPPPPARFRHAAVWDTDRGQMLVFGGAGERAFDDLWAYGPSANAWTSVTTTGAVPSPRSHHVAVWDTAGSQMLVFGGVWGGPLNDLWAYRPAAQSWTWLAPEGQSPPTHFLHAAVWDPAHTQMIVFGGYGGGLRSDMWAYRPRTNTWTRLAQGVGPGPGRGPYTSVWSSATNQVLALSDRRGPGTNEIWTYLPATEAWTQPPAAPSIPSARFGHTAVATDVVDSARSGTDAPGASTMLLFGGSSGGSQFLGDLWTYRASTDLWVPLSPTGMSPAARGNHAAVWDSTGKRLIVFGGRNSEGYVNDVWSYDTSRNRWTQLSPRADGASLESSSPASREEHTAVWDPRREQMLVFGGARDSRTLDDLWSFRPHSGTWTRLQPEGPTPPDRFRHAAVWDPAGDRMLVFGGYGDGVPGRYLNDLWAYEPATNSWTELTPAEPPPARSRQAVVWDATAQRLLVLGGFAGGIDYLNDIWTYEPEANRWRRLETTGLIPTPRASQSAIWDVETGSVLTFGGYGGGPFGELWSFRPPDGSRLVQTRNDGGN